MKIVNLGRGPEIFASVQGEGRNVGRFSVFVRSSLCNLQCIWCDTDYTWNWKGTPFKHLRDSEPNYKKYDQSTEIVDMSAEQVAAEVVRLRARNVVLTGGEPLLHQEGFVDLMKLLRQQDEEYAFEVETNGTILPVQAFDGLISQYNVSPKLANSNNSSKIRLRPEVLTFFANSPKAWFKFVCESGDDIDEVRAIAEEYEIPASRVFLMPQGTTTEEVRRIGGILVGRCIEFGFNFTDRLHIHLFSNKRGT